jgi:hypothetical protein
MVQTCWKKLLNFDRAEDYRKLVWNTASRESAFRPGRLQSDVVEEFSGQHEVVDRLGRILPLIDHIQLVFAKFFQAQVFGTGLIKSRQAGNVMQVGSLRSGAEIAQLHVFDHALTKRCHAMAPWGCWIGHWGITESIVPQEPRAMLMAWLWR